MKYDFSSVIDRNNTNSMKWNVGEEVIPLWVADMDFATAPCVIEALEKRAKHGIFGYSEVPDSWYQAYISWWKNYHNYEISKDSLIFCTGTVLAISSIIRRMTEPGQEVLMLTPIYNTFYNSIINNGCKPLEVAMNYDSVTMDYGVDWHALELAMSRKDCKLMIFCNPHNPLMRIWSKEQIDLIGKMAHEYGVVVISDEVHCDLVDPGNEYIPFASVSETNAMNSITCIAPSKTFNLAGLQSAAVMVPNDILRKRVERGLNTDEVAEPNSFAIDATVAAFTEGREWVEELRQVIADAKSFVKMMLEEKLPDIKVLYGPATYLVWLDVSKYMETDKFKALLPSDCQADFYSEKGGWYTGAKSRSEVLADYLTKEYGVMLSFGALYGKGGDNFLRMNVACPDRTLEEGLFRLCLGLESLL